MTAMKEYIKISNEKGYQILNSGPLLLISSISFDNKNNIAPIAWQCLVNFEPVTKMMIACDKDHKTFKNILETKQFCISVPHISQLKLVKDLGSCTGNEIDKFEKFKLTTIKCDIVKCIAPEDCIAYLECRVYNIITNDSTGLIFGEVLNTKVDKLAYNGRLLSEKESGKTIHHLGGKVFISMADQLLK
jgi:flavin reductase (DIM6/NTAB) family NADH-FMN oxidoreductase RutF